MPFSKNFNYWIQINLLTLLHNINKILNQTKSKKWKNLQKFLQNSQ